MVIRHIYDRDQQLSPGGLTMLKVRSLIRFSGKQVNEACQTHYQGAMVSNSTLAAVCVWSGLHEHLHYDSPELSAGIQAYINDLKERQDDEYKAAEQEGRDPGQYWQDIEPPKVSVEFSTGYYILNSESAPPGTL